MTNAINSAVTNLFGANVLVSVGSGSFGAVGTTRGQVLAWVILLVTAGLIAVAVKKGKKNSN